jgi:hypothetical protein
MKKIPPGDVTTPESSHQFGVSMMAPVQFETMMAANKRMFEQIVLINRIWLAAVQEANSTGSDLAARLVQGRNPAEGVGLCSEWIRECATRFASDSRQATELWMGLYGSAFAAPGAAPDPHRTDEERGSGREKHPSSNSVRDAPKSAFLTTG